PAAENTTQSTWTRRRATSSSRSPPQPISMSSAWAPRQSTRSGERVAGSDSAASALGARAGVGLERTAMLLFVPDFPGGAAPGVDLLELLAILEGAHRHPEAVVLVGHEPALGDEPLERLAHQLLAVAEVVEDLGPEDEEAAVDADRRQPHLA